MVSLGTAFNQTSVIKKSTKITSNKLQYQVKKKSLQKITFQTFQKQQSIREIIKLNSCQLSTTLNCIQNKFPTQQITLMGNQRFSRTQSLFFFIDPLNVVRHPFKAVVVAHKTLGKLITTFVLFVTSPFHNDGFSRSVDYHVQEIQQNIKTKVIRIKSIWIGGRAQFLSQLKFLFLGMQEKHWWIQIQTQNPNVWYWAELNIDSIILKRLTSSTEVDRLGIEVGNGRNDTLVIQKVQAAQINMHNIRKMILETRNIFHYGYHNCQHWATYLFERITGAL